MSSSRMEPGAASPIESRSTGRWHSSTSALCARASSGASPAASSGSPHWRHPTAALRHRLACPQARVASGAGPMGGGGMRRVLAGAAMVVLAMVAAPAAHGAVVRAVDNEWITTLEYDAGPGEANRVVVTFAFDPSGDYVATIEDRGAIIATTTPTGLGGSGCAAAGLH